MVSTICAKIRFSFEDPGKTTSRKDREVEDGQRRAHAATISHSRRGNTRKDRKEVNTRKNATPIGNPASRSPSGQCDPIEEENDNVIAQLDPRCNNKLTHFACGPFGKVKSMSGEAHLLMHLCVTQTWPALLPMRFRENPKQLVQSYLEMTSGTEIVLHSILSIMPYHLKRFQGLPVSPKMELVALKHQSMAVKILKDEIGKKTTLTDGALYAIMTLGVNGDDEPLLSHGLSSTSPLARAQHLHIYGTGVKTEAHINAMYSIAKQKGGLRQIKTKIVADTLELADLIISTSLMQNPQFDWRWQSARGWCSRWISDSGWQPPKSPTYAFRQMPTIQDPDGDDALLRTLQSTMSLTAALDEHMDSARNELPPWIIQARNAVQHQLLSLHQNLVATQAEYGLKPLGKIVLPTPIDQRRMREAVRLAALLFSDLVMFPLPPETGHRSRLTNALSSVLSSLRLSYVAYGHDPWSGAAELLQWIATMGLIGSGNSGDRYWFYLMLRRTVSWDLTVDPAAQTVMCRLRKVLEGHLWSSHLCDEHLFYAWIAVRKAGEQEERK